jgi:hypothetical protein
MFEIQLNIHATKYVTCIKANLTFISLKVGGKKKFYVDIYMKI